MVAEYISPKLPPMLYVAVCWPQEAVNIQFVDWRSQVPSIRYTNPIEYTNHSDDSGEVTLYLFI